MLTAGALLNLAAITRSLCSLQGELERKAALRQRVLDDQRRMGMVAAG
jgi:hypothetical protein